MAVTHLGIDLRKLAFHVVGQDEVGRVQLKQKFTKLQLLKPGMLEERMRADPIMARSK